MNLDQSEFRLALETNAADYGLALAADTLDRLGAYYELLSAWNQRLHLVAPTTPKRFATRHILESLLLLEHLPKESRVADIGSGAGLPIIPCLIARPDLRAMLIESTQKKAVFLREALSQTEISGGTTVIADRFENTDTPDVGFVTCRALERFEKMVPQLIDWAPAQAVFLFFGGDGLGKSLKELSLNFTAHLIPNSTQRFLYVATR